MRDNVPNCVVPFAGYTGDTACHLMVVLRRIARRDLAVAILKERKIQTSLHYPCIPDFTAFAAFAGAPVDRARRFAQRAITLPLHPLLKPEQVLEILLSCAMCWAAARRSAAKYPIRPEPDAMRVLVARR